MQNGDIIWWIASILAGGGSIPLAWALVQIGERINKHRRPSFGPNPIRVPCASASSDLIPLIRGLGKAGVPFRGSELWIFGSDGRYIVKDKNRRLQRQFGKWSKDGLKIKYILLNADEDVSAALHHLKGEIGERFEVVALDEGAIPETAKALDTYHPTLFQGADGQNAAWIEGLHRRDSIFAYDVDYVSPLAMKRNASEQARFQSCKRQLDLVVKHSHSLTERVA